MGAWLVWTLLGGGAIAAFAVGRLVSQHEGDRIWGEAARRLSLRHDGGVWPVSNRSLEGTFEELTVEVREVRRARQYVPQVSVRGPAIDARLELSEERFTRQLERLFGGGDIETGDVDFDRTINVQGDAAAALASLAQETRAEVLEFSRLFHLELSRQRLTITLPRPVDGPDELVRATYGLVALARALALPAEGIAAALARGATSDANPKVRKRLLELLAQRFPRHPATSRVLDEALRDADDEVRTAAMLTGQSAAATAALGERAKDRGESVQRRLEALRALAGRADAQPTLSDVLTRLLECPEIPLQVEAAAIVGAERLVRHFESLRNLALYAAPEAQRAAALALGVLGEVRAESTLLGLVLRDDAGVQEASARALGELGTLRAIASLRHLLNEPLARSTVRDAAQVAIARIQQRAGCAEAGSLTLVAGGPEAGGLSVSSEGGGLSVAVPVGDLALAANGSAPGDTCPGVDVERRSMPRDTLTDAVPPEALAGGGAEDPGAGEASARDASRPAGEADRDGTRARER